jgi:uncharacterized protein (DUF697 family)
VVILESEGRLLAIPRVGSPKGFWKEIKSISVAEIAKEAGRPLSIAVVGGDSELREAIIDRMYLPAERGASRAPLALPASPFVQTYTSMLEDDGFPVQPDVFDFVIDMGGGRPQSTVDIHTPIYSVTELGGIEKTLDRIYEDRHELSLALARNFPVFRTRAAQHVIQQTAMTNAEFSLLTGVVSAFPLFGLLLPANALSDILLLTKNQIMMCLRLAAVYGLEVNYKARMRELAPILINAFSWRSVARELVGAVPAVGFVFRAMISYAGTVAVGKAAQLYYECGETLTRSQARRIYRDAYVGSKDRIRALADRLRPGRGKGGGGRTRSLTAAGQDGATGRRGDGETVRLGEGERLGKGERERVGEPEEASG